ncbi:Zinc finger protein CONSTANS-LIKE 3 [Glycine soja]|nr:Zinc finger protein CONSTANS-LIKE 3 [Glycine soja]
MGSPSSLASNYESRRVVQRSVSSHSLQKNGRAHHQPFSEFSPLFVEFIDSENGPVRRACSTGDLQRFNGMQHFQHSDSSLSSESSLIIEEMSRTSPYSPEEKKVRIERYRNKRNQRNFGKKIKYACRKTLADSRPRIRGRFARNDETAKNPPAQWSHMGNGEEEDEEEENWADFFDSLVPANIAQEPQGSSSSFGVFY